MTQTLKERTISGMVWSFVHRFGTMTISFIANIVLARLLTPEDFGIIGMIMVFVAISSIFVDGGFASALIQKKNPTEDDYSTIFYWNLIVSVLVFVSLYFVAPAIERFYEMPALSTYFRVVSLILIINAFSIIQLNQLNKKLNFKKIANINIAAAILGAVIGITMAYLGFGVWSLVAKMLALSFFQSVFLWLNSNWRPALIFSSNSLKGLFSFGSFMLLTSLLNKIYENIQGLIIGKMFSAGILGYYTQAKNLQQVPVQGLSAIVNQVTFPVFSELQDDLKRLKHGISQSLQAVTFLNFPMMILIIILAKPIIILLLTEKWSQSILYLQVLAFAGMIYTLNTANTNIFKAVGRSDTYFYVTLVKRIIGIALIFIGAQFGIMEMLYAIVLNTYLFFLLNAYYSQKLTGYTIWNQVKDIGPSYILSILLGFFIYYLFNQFDINSLIILIIFQSTLYLLLYLILSFAFSVKGFDIYYNIVMKKIGS